MKKKKKKYNFHPLTVILFSILGISFLSLVLSLLKVNSGYSVVDNLVLALKVVPVKVKNVFSFEGLRFLLSKSINNFLAFKPFVTLIITLIGIAVSNATGYLDAVSERVSKYLNNWWITFFTIFLGTISSLVGEIGYAILIPLSAIIFLKQKRNPLLGIIAAFVGVSFGYGTSVFAGVMEMNLIPITQEATYLVDQTAHIALLSNLFIGIVTSVVISIVGTFVIENIISNKLGKYNFNKEEKKEIDSSEEINKELVKRGLRYANITIFVLLIIYIYAIIPGLPLSGLLLDQTQTTYVLKLFGPKAYFENSFTLLVMFILTLGGISYAFGAETIKNDKDLYDKVALNLNDLGYILLLTFSFSQLVSVFEQTQIDLVLTASLANMMNALNFQGIPLIIMSMIIISLSGLILPSTIIKWKIFSPIMIPTFIKASISPQFGQFIFRAADSMTKGFSIFAGGFIIYVIYLNIYNTEEHPVTFKKALDFILPYAGIIIITWISLILFWYILGLPVGPFVNAIL